MDSDDVCQPKFIPPPHPIFSFSLSYPFSPSPQEVDYGSGDEMEEDDGDMFVDEDLDLQARYVHHSLTVHVCIINCCHFYY